MSEPVLLTISGSLREGSYNRMLCRVAAEAFGPAKVVVGDLDLPLYNGDLESAEGIPAKVQMLADQIAGADAIVISAPEYNKGISGVLKNALDWVSRTEGNAFAGKPTVVVSAAAGRTGGETAQFMTMACLLQLQAQIISGPAVLVAGASKEFSDAGALTNDRYHDTLKTRMAALRAAIKA